MAAQKQQQQQQQQTASCLSDSLYCEEEPWEGELREDCWKGEEEEEECYYGDDIGAHSVLWKQEECFWEEELSSLFSKEEQEFPFDNLETSPLSLSGARREAVEWILKVAAFYSFSASTAVLAVNYLDRFILSFKYQTEKPWMYPLAAVTCLSLAAKVEETQVPLIVDLQVEESKYVFEARTIQRMEILVLSTLKWKMNPVTPLSFVDYIVRRLALKNHLCWEFLRRCECLVLSVIADSGSMCYRPSVMATATMLHIINGVVPCIGSEYQNQLLGILGMDQRKLADCGELIQELTKGAGFRSTNKRKFGSLPGSPKGVMDASFSSDSSNDSWAAAAAAASASSSPEPLSKKSRAQEQPLPRHNHANP